jgi:hypothetical protein
MKWNSYTHTHINENNIMFFTLKKMIVYESGYVAILHNYPHRKAISFIIHKYNIGRK